ncbi:MAG: hypothetical protein RPT11_04910 [Bermanella sp.]
MTTALMIAAAKVEDNQGQLDDVLHLEEKLEGLGIHPEHLVIEPLSADWNAPERPGYYRSGCGPLEALAQAKRLIEAGSAAVVISGIDHLRTGYERDERLSKMAVYGNDYPLTEAYTELAQAFSERHEIDSKQFKALAAALFENHKVSFRNALSHDFHEGLLPGPRWHQPITDLFLGVDCANPMVDFSGRVLISNAATADLLAIEPQQRLVIKAVGLSRLAGDGRDYLQDIVSYDHLRTAYAQACQDAGIDFAARFRQGEALLETYTCYPVVPMAFLIVSGLVDVLDDMPEFLAQHSITVTGGMNLAKAAWNNPALNGLITMYRRLCDGSEALGLVHGNGGLGYRQGVAIMATA